MCYKLAEDYQCWYPDDPDLAVKATPVSTSRPPDNLPPLKPLADWPQFNDLRRNIIADSKDLQFLELRHA